MALHELCVISPHRHKCIFSQVWHAACVCQVLLPERLVFLFNENNNNNNRIYNYAVLYVQVAILCAFGLTSWHDSIELLVHHNVLIIRSDRYWTLNDQTGNLRFTPEQEEI